MKQRRIGSSSTKKKQQQEAQLPDVDDSSKQNEVLRSSPLTIKQYFVLFLFLWLIRAGNALLVRTQFDPDEFWQGPEPARRLVFGRGWLTWEWAETIAIRSWIHPILLAVPLKVLDMVGLIDVMSTEFIAFAPRIFVQAPLMALSDLSVASLASRINNSGDFKLGLFLTLTNWFNFYCGIRTYTNSFEGCLTNIALAFWPLSAREARSFDLTISLLLAAVTIVVRPSALVIWIYLGFCLAFVDLGIFSRQLWITVISRVVPIGISAVTLSIVVDSYLYTNGTFRSAVFVPWNFFHLNFVKNISALYGVHSVHWYFSQCFPAILGIQLPLVLHGMYLALKQRNETSTFRRAEVLRLSGLIGFGLAVLSLSAHKEMRFAFPFIGIAIAISTLSLEVLKDSLTLKPIFKGIGIAAIILAGVIPALFLGLVHQKAAIDVGFYLSDHVRGSVDILLPCHAMPLWALIHPTQSKVHSMKFLDCSPHLKELEFAEGRNSSFKHNGSNETFAFIEQPKQFIMDRYTVNALPDAVVTGSKYVIEVEAALTALLSSTSRGPFRRCAEFDHAQDDVGGQMIVFC